jgi:hypothetical protein
MDVGVDTHDFRPWHFDEINLLMTEKAKGLSELRRTDLLNIQQFRVPSSYRHSPNLGIHNPLWAILARGPQQDVRKRQ